MTRYAWSPGTLGWPSQQAGQERMRVANFICIYIDVSASLRLKTAHMLERVLRPLMFSSRFAFGKTSNNLVCTLVRARWTTPCLLACGNSGGRCRADYAIYVGEERSAGQAACMATSRARSPRARQHHHKAGQATSP